jgi:hypothetical protein
MDRPNQEGSRAMTRSIVFGHPPFSFASDEQITEVIETLSSFLVDYDVTLEDPRSCQPYYDTPLYASIYQKRARLEDACAERDARLNEKQRGKPIY